MQWLQASYSNCKRQLSASINYLDDVIGLDVDLAIMYTYN